MLLLIRRAISNDHNLKQKQPECNTNDILCSVRDTPCTTVNSFSFDNNITRPLMFAGLAVLVHPA